MSRWWLVAVVFTAVLGLVATGTAFAQGASGKGALYGTARGTDGSAVPGVTVTLTGPGAPQVAVSDTNGNFRYLILAPGSYQLTAALDGFATVEYPEIDIRVNQDTTIEITMSAAVEEVITVTSETPILDTRKIQQQTTLTRTDLDKIPTSRDPFELVRQAPGVIVDRVNVGGNESGQQASFMGTGAFGNQNKFLIDGVDITDQSALGASSTYFGFEQFDSIQLATGGSNIEVMTPGVQVNMVTKRGTNEWRGSATTLRTDGDWQSEPSISTGDLAPGQVTAGETDASQFTGNQIKLIKSWGGELGGSAVRDKLFFWVAYDLQDIDQNVFGGQSDDTDLENIAGKVNSQWVSSNSIEVSWNQGDKQKFGRGASPNVAPESTWNQTGPSPAWKAEMTQMVGGTFFVTGHWSRMGGGFKLTPLGGFEGFETQDDTGFLFGSRRWLDTKRPTYRYQLNASNFFNTGETSHELKYGAAFRRANNISGSGWPGTGDLRGAEFDSGVFLGLGEPNQVRLRAWRDRIVSNSVDYTSVWAQDTFTKGRLTINAGLRLDIQEGENAASSAPEGALSGLGGLPALSFEGNKGSGFDPNTGQELDAFEWNEIAPRVGVTYAMGEDRKTLLRANYSRFSEQLGTGTIERVNPLGFAWAQFYFTDLNGNFFLDDSERDSLELAFVNGGASAADPDFTDPGLSSPITDELSLGVEHSFSSTLVGSATLILRQQTDVLETRQLVVDETGTVRTTTPADWEVVGNETGTLPNGTAYSVPVYDVRDGLEEWGGSFLVNGDRETSYTGLSFAVTKRLANQWMLRGNFTWNDWEWDIPDSFQFFDDPTDGLDVNTNPAGGTAADNDGAQVTETSAGSGAVDSYLSSNWSFNLMGLYQVAPDRKWNFNIGANISGREGFPLPYFGAFGGREVGGASVQVTDTVDSFRLDDVYTMDLRIDKDFSVGDFGLTVGIDAFNVLNEGTILGRENQNDISRANFVDQTLGPRIFRVQLKVSFR